MWVEHLQIGGKGAFCLKVPIQLQGKGFTAVPLAVRTKESREGTGFLNCLLLLSGRDTAQGAKEPPAPGRTRDSG